MKIPLRMLAALAVLAIAAPAQAQGGGRGGMGGGGQMSPEQRLATMKEQLFKGIDLSAEQSAKVDTVLQQSMRTQMEAMQAARGGGGDMRETMQKLNSERNEKLKALLTRDEQKKKFDENVANMPQMGRRGGTRS